MLSKKESSSNGVKSISIVGSTGAIGQNTVDVIRENRELYDIIALTANNDVDLLVKQAKLLKPKYAVIGNHELHFKLQKELENYDIKTMSGRQGLLEVSNFRCDIYVCAIIGCVRRRYQCYHRALDVVAERDRGNIRVVSGVV